MTPNRFPSACVAYTPEFPLESMSKQPSFYWAHMLLPTLGGIPELKLEPLEGVILAGPPGNGRHTIAMGLSGTLANQGWPFFARISGITLDTEDVADACAVIDGAMSKLRQHGRICLLVDCPENSRHNLAIQEYLRQQMDYHPGKLFLILITGALANITPTLQTKKITACQFQIPDLATRQRWLRTYLEGKPPIPIDGNINYITLTKETNGFTWRQLTDLRTLLRRALAMKYFQNSQTYAAAGPREKLLASGTVHLSKEEVYAALACIRSQGVSTAAAPAGAVQYVAAMPAGTVPAAGTTAVASAPPAAPAAKPPASSAPSASDKLMTEEEKDAAAKAIDFHSHPEKMNAAQLMDIDNL